MEDHETIGSLRDLLANRGDFVRVFLIGSVLAVGLDLGAGLIEDVVGSDVRAVVTALSVLCAFGALGVGVFGSRRVSAQCEAVLIYDPVSKTVVRIPEYAFSESVCRTLTAVLKENPAFQSSWEKEPPVLHSPFPTGLPSDAPVKPNSQPYGNASERSHVAVYRVEKARQGPEPKAFALLREVLEFVVIDKLSTHLSDYFDRLGTGDRFTKEYKREDLPALLLQNRVLALLSSPLEDRASFLGLSLPNESISGELHMLLNDDGTQFVRFDLTLPTDSRVQRTAPGSLEIGCKRLKLCLKITYDGISAIVPDDFLYHYVGVDRPSEAICQRVTVDVEGILKPGALLRPDGWRLYQWVDSFIPKLADTCCFESYLHRICWSEVATQLRVRAQHVRRTRKRTDTAGLPPTVGEQN